MYKINKVSAIHLDTEEYVFFYTLNPDDDDDLDDFFTNPDGSINEDADYDDYEMGDWKDCEEYDNLDEATKRFNELKADPSLL